MTTAVIRADLARVFQAGQAILDHFDPIEYLSPSASAA